MYTLMSLTPCWFIRHSLGKQDNMAVHKWPPTPLQYGTEGMHVNSLHSVGLGLKPKA